MGLSLSMHVSTLSGAGGHFEFNSQTHKTIKIGRVQTAQVCLDDARAARVHAVVELSATEANLVDMGSTIGTLINGAKATRIKLNHGDTIVIGDTHIAIAFNAQAQAVPQMLTPGGPIASAPLPAAGMATPASFIPPVATQAPPVPATGPSATSAAPPKDQTDPEEAAVRRRSQLRLRAAITEAKPHPGLPAEDPLSRDNRVLELRLYWGDVLMGMNHYTRPKKVTIGENIQADIFLSSEGLPTEQFPLVRYRDGEYLLGFTGAMQGEIETAAQTRTVQQLIERAGQPGGASKDAELDGGFTLPLDPDARALLHWGGATFALRFVPPARLIPAPFGKNIDWQFANSSIFSVFSVIALIAALAVYPHNTDALKVDLFAAPDRFASLILEAPKETKSTRDMLEKIKKQVEEKKEERQEKQKEVADKRPDILKQAVKMPVTAAAAQRTAEDKKQEVTKRFSKLLGGGAGSLLGGGGGGNLAGTLQNVIGTAGDASASAGLAGLGIRGTGPLTGGGIGTSRGLAGIGTTGRLGGGGANYGSGVGLGRGKAHNLVDLETPTVEGALSSDVIKRVINENKNQVRYCYEVELQHNQNLEGRVQMRWIIAASGAVAQVSVKDSTIKNANVENCLMAKIRNWKFPPPAGGGTVEVNYPFVFKAS